MQRRSVTPRIPIRENSERARKSRVHVNISVAGYVMYNRTFPGVRAAYTMIIEHGFGRDARDIF